MKDSLAISPEFKKQITNILSGQGLSSEDMQEIFEGSYQSFSTAEEFSLKIPSIFNNDEYTNIIQGLSDDYTFDEMAQELGINQKKINLFRNLLAQNNLSVDSVKAFNKYTVESNMILQAKRGVPKKDILQSIMSEFNFRTTEYGFFQEQIEQIWNYIKGLDYSRPLHENYKFTRKFLQQYGLSSKYVTAIQTSVRSLDSYHHLNETLSSLDKGLLTSLPESMKLFRAVKGSFLKKRLQQNEDLTSLVGLGIDDKGYSSTSPLYDTSFAKYDDYDVVFDIYVPKGSQGMSVAPFSSYGTSEQEILLNSNTLYIIDVIPRLVDKNGRTKTVCKALMLSKDTSCYKGIHKKQQIKQNIDLIRKSKEELAQLKDEISNRQQIESHINDSELLNHSQKPRIL